jgi:hypothetical protein
LVLIALSMTLILSSCTPYPMYNNSRNSQEEYAAEPTGGDSEAVDRQGGVQTAAVDVEAVSDDVMPSAIEPRVFKRVVESYIGIPYESGGDGKDGLDCSNLVVAVYRDYAGKHLSTSTRSLFRLPMKVSQDALQVGDLVFFSFNGGNTPDHVGVYIGEGRFVHASESRGVIYSTVDTPYFRDAYRGARRVM